MAGRAFKNHLIHQCMVQRTTPAQSSSGELINAWANVGTIDCRFVEKTERTAAEGEGFPMLKTYLLLVDAAANVLVYDRISSVVWKADGTSIDAGPFSIEAVLNRNRKTAHHISLQLERVE